MEDAGAPQDLDGPKSALAKDGGKSRPRAPAASDMLHLPKNLALIQTHPSLRLERGARRAG